MKPDYYFKPPWLDKTGKKALVTGITGQDGSYLAEFLLSKGYEVWGMVRRSSSINTWRIDHIYEPPWIKDKRLNLVYGDLNDASSLNRILKTVRPDEIYNLGAQSHVKVSFEVPEYTTEVTGVGVIRLLEAMRDLGLDARFYQASSSELYGKAVESPPARPTRCASSATSPSPASTCPSPGKERGRTKRASALTAVSSSRSTRATCGPPRWSTSSVTRPRPNANSAGNPPSPSPTSPS